MPNAHSSLAQSSKDGGIAPFFLQKVGANDPSGSRNEVEDFGEEENGMFERRVPKGSIGSMDGTAEAEPAELPRWICLCVPLNGTALNCSWDQFRKKSL